MCHTNSLNYIRYRILCRYKGRRWKAWEKHAYIISIENRVKKVHRVGMRSSYRWLWRETKMGPDWRFWEREHHHHVMPPARISLTLSCHFSLLFIASGRSSGLHPISSHRCCMYVLAGNPALARPYVGVHRNTSLMSSSMLLQQCPACLIHLTWIFFMIGGRWPNSWCFVGCCRREV